MLDEYDPMSDVRPEDINFLVLAAIKRIIQFVYFLTVLALSVVGGFFLAETDLAFMVVTVMLCSIGFSLPFLLKGSFSALRDPRDAE
ncbi:MAG: hypothetical protein HN985_11225 [Planctomycetaceae bacterium]|jgi:hypothetical protein|nr:hypothetical protein [Planctomycetaceae bacterium]MBT4885582.1 hypothetical protein [Planctomycetaceae bacterium]MBT6055011.1 hypothetical protein [Planctomycetaceae bacterium]MBT6920283.1 hypothetical protein [Planctomycetaceae bacterium]|tara:strand:- start:113 stop:373 length:261 start_codon:yes stop_codon:yes gene_type:complete